jgi:hypothetical protein
MSLRAKPEVKSRIVRFLRRDNAGLPLSGQLRAVMDFVSNGSASMSIFDETESGYGPHPAIAPTNETM